MFAQRPLALGVLILLAMSGMGIVLLSTHQGVGISADSTRYIDASRHFLQGHGLSISVSEGKFKPFTFYPLFPSLLSLIGLFGVDPVIGARWFNICIFGINIFLVGYLIKKYTESFRASFIGSVLALSSYGLILSHSYCWTEPLFICLTLVTMYFIAIYIDSHQGIFLFIAAVASSLAVLTRYAGIPLIVSAMVGIYLLNKSKPRDRIMDMLRFAGISLFPLVFWLLRNFYLTHTFIHRKIIFRPGVSERLQGLFDFLRDGVINMGTQFDATGILIIITRLIIVSLLVISFFLRKEQKWAGMKPQKHFAAIPILFLSFILFYAVSFIIVLVFFDAAVSPVNLRYWAPLYVSVIMLVIGLPYRWLAFMRQGRLSLCLTILLGVIFPAVYLKVGLAWAEVASHQGLGYNNLEWKRSATMQKIKSFPPHTLIYSNGSDVIYFLTGRVVQSIPFKVNPSQGRENGNYLSQITDMREELEKKRGVVVYFNMINRPYLPSENELRKSLLLQPLLVEPDGDILGIVQGIPPNS
jgi:hypothetical protein